MSTQNYTNHPISVIASFAAFRPSQKIKIHHNRDQFKRVFEDVENQLDQFDTLTDFAMSAFNVSDDIKLKKIHEKARKTLICSFLAPDFIEKYETQIREKTSEETLNFIKKKIGKDTDYQQCEKAIEKLNNATRDAAGEEEFSDFLERIKNIADKMAGKEQSVKTHFIDSAFRKNLTPSIREFLVDQDSQNKSIEDIASLLDRRKKYKKSAEIFQLETSNEKIENLTSMLSVFAEQKHADSKRIESLLEQNEKMMNMLHNKFSDFDAEICKLRTTTKNLQEIPQNRNENLRPKTEPKSGNKDNFPATWELNKAGFPVRCTACGFQGHSHSVCRGTRASCHLCKKQGHIVFACPNRTNFGNNSNSAYSPKNY